jgi:hypothetical protein
MMKHTWKLLSTLPFLLLLEAPAAAQIGFEGSSYERLNDGDEFDLPLEELLSRGQAAFNARWTVQQGGGRPQTSGVGAPLADPSSPLVFPRNFNRVSAMDSNGCAGCHNSPFGIAGGEGDFVTGVFVAAQRFDSATFDHSDPVAKRGAVDEAGNFVTLQSIGNFRSTPGMFGGGYIELLAREITADLQAARDGLAAGDSVSLVSKGISFGMLSRAADGSWSTNGVRGIPKQSLTSSATTGPPSLIIHPWHQSGSVISLRQFTNNALNHHHGMQTAERFGAGVDADQDGFADELTVADVTAVSLYQATMPVPGQLVPNDLGVEQAIFNGERLFRQIGCATCHIPELPLGNSVYSEPSPYNPIGNLQAGDGQTFEVDLSVDSLPGYRGSGSSVKAYTDLKLHDITSGPDDPNADAIDINAPGGTEDFLDGTTLFLTRRLWGVGNTRPYFHHGKFTTIREATLAHAGEALDSKTAFMALSNRDRNNVIEFLKSLQILPPDVTTGIVDENMQPKLGWPPRSFFSWRFTHGTH